MNIDIKKKGNSGEFVSRAFESLDYDRHGNDLIVHEEEARGKIFLASIVMQRVLLYVLIGVFSGILGGLMEVGVHYGSILRYSILKKNVENYINNSLGYVYAIWIVSIFVPGILAGVLVLYGAPFAAGGGVHWCLGYLNGINLNSHMTFKVLLIKMFSCILCVVSGLPGGKEAPLIHIGTIVGAITPLLGIGKLQPFDYFHQEPELRDMAAAGSGAGLTAAFSTPLAGIMMSFEESMSFWNVDLTFLIFICTVTTYISLRIVVQSVVYNCPACFARESNFFLEVVTITNEKFYTSEIISFMFLGILGGLLGALWNCMQKHLILLRKRFVNTEGKKFFEITVFCVLVGIYQVALLTSMSNHCIKKDPNVIFIDVEHDNHVQLDCKSGDIPTVSLLLFQDPVHIFRSLFTTDDESLLGIRPLFFYGVYYFFGSCLLCGMAITHGIFIPHLLTGGVWGRTVAEIIIHFYPEAKSWASPNKFAFLCAVAQLSGCLHLTYTISVMLLETCNSTQLAIPMFIVVCFAKSVASLFNKSIYHTQAYLCGLAMLEKEAPPGTSHIKAMHVMSKPVVTLPLTVTNNQLLEVLKNTKNNGFPIVESQSTSSQDGLVTFGALRGIIQRSNILAILNEGLKIEDLSDMKRLKHIRQAFCNSKIIREDIQIDGNAIVNLQPFMNSSPYVINADATFPQTYMLFANLGIRHLVVVNNNLKVLGVITRKDLSVYRENVHLLKSETVIIPLK